MSSGAAEGACGLWSTDASSLGGRLIPHSQTLRQLTLRLVRLPYRMNLINHVPELKPINPTWDAYLCREQIVAV